MSGTFIARANVNGDVNLQANGAANAAILTGTADSAIALKLPADLKLVSCGGAAPASFNVQANCKLFLDGSSAPINSVNDLPPGFIVTAATIIIAASWNGGFDDYINANSNGSITWKNIDIGPSLKRFGNGASVTYTVPTSIPLSLPITNIDIFSALGFRASYTSGMNIAVEQLIINGTYDIQPDMQYEVAPEISPIIPSNPGEDDGTVIEITSDPNDPDAMQLDELDGITIEFTDDDGNPQSIDVTFYILIDVNILQFVIPDFDSFTPGTVNIVATGNGTQFSGSVTLIKLQTIYFLNAPGIYTLVPGKTNDTLYDTENGGTIDVKIPDPFAKLGYIGG